MNCTSRPCKANITKQYLKHLIDKDLMHFPPWATINTSTLATFSKPQLKKKWTDFPSKPRYIESKSFARAPAVSIWAVKCTCLFFKKQLHFKWLIHCQKRGFLASFLQATAFSTHSKLFLNNVSIAFLLFSIDLCQHLADMEDYDFPLTALES